MFFSFKWDLSNFAAALLSFTVFVVSTFCFSNDILFSMRRISLHFGFVSSSFVGLFGFLADDFQDVTSASEDGTP